MAHPGRALKWRRLFAQVDSTPYWLDRAKLDRAARVTCRTGVWGMLALGMLALNGGYLAFRADKTLVGAGGLAAEAMAPRRLAETANWWVDVTTPGGLGRFEDGFKGILRVRLMHAMVRAGMNRRPDWDHEQWDHPVNQSLTAATLMLFSMANIMGCQAVGVQFTGREKVAVYHFWRYVGYLLGLDPQILPADEADTWRLLWLQTDYELLPDEDGKVLSQALMASIAPGFRIGGDNIGPRVVHYALTRYLGSYSRILIGKANADFLGTPYNTPFMAAVLATAVINTPLELTRRTIPGATRFSENLGHRIRTRLVHTMVARTSGDRTYRRHDTLATTAA